MEVAISIQKVSKHIQKDPNISKHVSKTVRLRIQMRPKFQGTTACETKSWHPHALILHRNITLITSPSEKLNKNDAFSKEKLNNHETKIDTFRNENITENTTWSNERLNENDALWGA